MVGEIIYNTDFKVPQYCDDTNWIAMTGGQEPLGAYEPNAVTFDGTNDYVTIDGTTITPSTRLTFSFWIKFNNKSTYYRVFHDNGDRTQIFINDDNSVAVFVRDASNSQVLGCQTGGTLLDDTTDWHHWMFSMDSATGDLHYYIDGVDVTPGWCSFNSTNAYAPNTNLRFGYDSYQGYVPADAADIWFDVGTYIDLSVASNRELFYNAGEAVYLGADGSLPTGSAPDIFLTGDTDSWHVNKGTAGGMTEVGALTTAPDAPTSSSTYESTVTEVVPSGLVAHWRLDETSGTEALDSSGNGINGNKNNGVSYVANGLVGGAAGFDGVSNQNITIPHNSLLTPTEDLTVTFWVQPQEDWDELGTDLWRIIDKQSSANSNDPGWYLYINGFFGGTFWLAVGDGVGTTIYGQSSFSDWDANTWYHIAFVYEQNGTTPTVSIYRNGVFSNSSTSGGPFTPDWGTDDLILGAGYYNNDLNGYLDDVRIYNRALTAAEVQQVYAARDGFRFNERTRAPEYFDGNGWDSMRMGFPEVPYGLVGHWRLDETSGTVASDSSDTGNNGTLQNGMDAANDTATGAVASAYTFNGINNYVDIPYNAAYVGNSETTLSGWFKTSKTTGFQTIVQESNANLVLYAQNDGKIGFEAYTDGSGYNYAEADVDFLTDTWYFVAAVFQDGVQSKVYVNGVDATTYADAAPTGSIRDQGVGLNIGYNPAGSDRPMFGKIDDVRVYNRALPDADILALYAMGAPVGQTTAAPQGCTNPGDRCDDGTVYAGLSPDGNVAMYAAASDGPGTYTWNDGSLNYTDTSMANCTTATPGTGTCLTGEANTLFLAAAGGEPDYPFNAAQYCHDLDAHGSSDWYLPSQDELNMLYVNRNTGGFAGTFVDNRYWSSSEYSSLDVNRQNFLNGNQSNHEKTLSFNVRCVRKGPAPRCANPYGVEGQMIFNSDHAVMQYCDGARWLAIGKAN